MPGLPHEPASPSVWMSIRAFRSVAMAESPPFIGHCSTGQYLRGWPGESRRERGARVKSHGRHREMLILELAIVSEQKIAKVIQLHEDRCDGKEKPRQKSVC